MHAKLLLLCLTLFDPMDCSLPGSSVHGILQTKILEWVAISFLHNHERINLFGEHILIFRVAVLIVVLLDFLLVKSY